MEDLISRQEAIDEIRKCRFVVDAIEKIRGLPSAQPKTGKWIRHDEVRNVYGGTCVECSECGEKYVVQYIEDEKYCRNCGADMRGEEE